MMMKLNNLHTFRNTPSVVLFLCLFSFHDQALKTSIHLKIWPPEMHCHLCNRCVYTRYSSIRNSERLSMGRSLSGHGPRANLGLRDQTWPLNLHASIRDVYPLKRRSVQDPKDQNHAILPCCLRLTLTLTRERPAHACIIIRYCEKICLHAIISLHYSDSDCVWFKPFLIITICTSYS